MILLYVVEEVLSAFATYISYTPAAAAACVMIDRLPVYIVGGCRLLYKVRKKRENIRRSIKKSRTGETATQQKSTNIYLVPAGIFVKNSAKWTTHRTNTKTQKERGKIQQNGDPRKLM